LGIYRLFFMWVMVFAVVCCATSGVPEGDPELIDIAQLAPGIDVQARYASAENFMGTVVDGYEKPLCLLTEQAAAALVRVQEEVASFGMHLVVFDCYRPQRAVDHFMRWTVDATDRLRKAEYYPNVDKARLVEEGYIAEKSGHSRGSTVDLSLAFDDGRELDMGTPFDFFDPTSNTEDAEIAPRARANRLLLRSVMERHGFRNYPGEWWHFTLDNEPLPTTYLDRPVK